jgi:hypothetical protein
MSASLGALARLSSFCVRRGSPARRRRLQFDPTLRLGQYGLSGASLGPDVAPLVAPSLFAAGLA